MINENISLGILTGISYVTGLDYYKSINEYVMQNTPPVYSLNPNPQVMLASVDCDLYVKLLEERNFEMVSEHLMNGVAKLVNGGCDHLAIASNTGHIAYNSIKNKYPNLNIIHIADCIAIELKNKEYYEVGLIGTKPTMEENYLIERLRLHGINIIVPKDSRDRIKIYDIICNELSYNVFKRSSREAIINIIKDLMKNNIKSCISGCTEIELLVKQNDIPNIDLFLSAQIHIKYISELLLGRLILSDIKPK